MATVPPPRGKGAPPDTDSTLDNLDKPERSALVPLNFKVPSAFRREFKIYAAEHELDMVQIFYEAFSALKRERAK